MEKLITTSDSGEPLIFKCQNAWKNLITRDSAAKNRRCDGGRAVVFLYDNIDAAKQQAKAGQIIALRDDIPFDELTQYKVNVGCVLRTTTS